MEIIQSNIYYYEKIKEYIVSTKDVPRRTKNKMKNLSQMTRFLCMHKILVHAQHSCACTTLLCMHWRGPGPRPGPKKSAGGPAWASAFFGSRPWSLALDHHDHDHDHDDDDHDQDDDDHDDDDDDDDGVVAVEQNPIC